MSQDSGNPIDPVRDAKPDHRSLGIETGYVVTQVHTLLLVTASELCWLAEQWRAKKEWPTEDSDEARYGAATILLVVAALEGAIHTAAAIVGAKYAAELPELELCLPDGRKRKVPPRELPSARGVSLLAKWRDIPPQLTVPRIVAPNPDGSSREMALTDETRELRELREFVETRHELLQHHHASAEPMPLDLIRRVSQDEDRDHVFAKHSPKRYNAVAARRACVLAADLISPLHDRLKLRGFWSEGLERVLRQPP